MSTKILHTIPEQYTPLFSTKFYPSTSTFHMPQNILGIINETMSVGRDSCTENPDRTLSANRWVNTPDWAPNVRVGYNVYYNPKYSLEMPTPTFNLQFSAREYAWDMDSLSVSLDPNIKIASLTTNQYTRITQSESGYPVRALNFNNGLFSVSLEASNEQLACTGTNFARHLNYFFARSAGIIAPIIHED